MTGTVVVQSNDGHARLSVERDADVAAIAALVECDSEVISFSYQPPTLSELFRQAVAA